MNSNNFVQVFTSLPPAIKRAEPFYFLNLHLNYVKFIGKSVLNYDKVAARVLWWGEVGDGAIFRPRIVNLAGHKQTVRTHARYDVSVPLPHFCTYLSDMDKLYVDFIDEGRKSIIGRAFIDDLKLLGCNKTLRSLCNICNETNDKIGEVMIVLNLENGPTLTKSDIENIKAEKVMIDNVEKLSSEIKSMELTSKLRDSLERIDYSHNLIDELIEKGKKLRETIAINVKDDEINEDIARKTFPKLQGKYTVDSQLNDDEWLKRMLIDQTSNNFSLNDISKINTESILASSPNLVKKHHTTGDKCNLNNDTEALKLLTINDSYCSDSNVDLYPYKYLTKSEEDIADLDKRVSSDDDPCKRDSIIEELFYKQKVMDKENIDESHNKIIQKVAKNDFSNKFTSGKSDYEIYQSLSKDPKHEKYDVVEENPDDLDDEDDDEVVNETVDSNWYKHISSIKVFLDMLWLNPHNPSPSKGIRSRSQSPNCSSDRERCRRSHDSASSFNNSSLSTNTSKPPVSRSIQWNASSRYFIEYKFPQSKDDENDKNKENYNIPRCPIRVALKSSEFTSNTSNTNNGVKVFELHHTSDFPVLFNNATVGKLWKSNVRFRLISQDYNNKESVVAVAVLPLRNVISTNNLHRLIPLRLPRTKINKARVVIGSLAVRTSMSTNNVEYDHIPENYPKKDLQPHYVTRNSPQKQLHVPRTISLSQRSNPHRPLYHNSQKSIPLRHTAVLTTSSKMHPINLVSLLSVSSVRYVSTKMSSGDYRSGIKSCNLFFVGRLIWAPDQKIMSRILWGSSKISDSESSLDLENFKLSEKIPLILTSDLLEKLKNNFAILEVWDKSMDNTKDSLYGLVKIPTNILAMSFKNDHIRNTVLNNVYPVMCCDDWINIEDAMSGKSKGQIHVMLAIGSHQQIDNLQLSKENTLDGHWNRNYIASSLTGGDLVEHVIELDLESLKNLDCNISADLSSKESFCYVQYYFPQQQTITETNGKNWITTTFRSVSHPIQRNVDICDTNSHKFRLPLDCSLKTFLNSHFEAMGKKHVLFELYSKQYNPFPSCRSLARGRLQLSSLYQLINQHSVSVDSVANTVTQQQIPIGLLSGEDSDAAISVGTLNICLCYKTKLVEKPARNSTSSNIMSPYDQPIIKIEVLAATGLQKAAESLLHIHPELEYASVTGLNTHVRYWITDESNKQSRINVNSKGFQKFKIHRTKTVPRSFIPKYEHITEVLLGSIVDEQDSNALCRTLAEKILMGIYQLNVEVYHDVPTSIYSDFEDNSSMSAILIAKGRTSLADLLLRSSGVMGPMWLTLFSPMNFDNGYGGCKLNVTGKRKPDSLYALEKRKAVGAVEIRLSLQNKSARKDILQLGMDVGYVIPWTNRLETEDLIWQSMDVHGCGFKNITVTVEEMELSAKLINCVFTAEAGFQRSSMRVLTRYRLYKQTIVSSPYFMLNEEELMERIFIPVNHQQQYCYRVSSDVYRYFRETKLEIQVWAIYGSSSSNTHGEDCESSDNPNDVRLLGSAFFDLSTLILPSDPLRKTVSHILPLWKRGIPNCDNANVTVTIDICGANSPPDNYNSDTEDNEYGGRRNTYQLKDSSHKIMKKSTTDSQQSFLAHISIEKAVNLKQLIQRSEDVNITDFDGNALYFLVTFPCSEDVSTKQSNIIKGFKDVTWNFECDTRLPYNLLSGSDSTLDFKLHYSPVLSDQMEEISSHKVLIGVVKMDLSLLMKGFERVIGWYNIVNMQGECQGQMKVGVTPLVPLVPKSAVLNSLKQPIPKDLKPFTLEDHQTYLANVRLRLHGDSNPLPMFSSTIPYNSVKDTSNKEADCRDSLSKSFLYSTLKEKLKELDNINETFKQKISRDEVVQTHGNDNNNAFVEFKTSEFNRSIESNWNDTINSYKNVEEAESDIEMRSLIKDTYINDFEVGSNESGSEFLEEQEEKENISKMIFLNDTGSGNDIHIQCHFEDISLKNDLPFENIKNSKKSNYESESECSVMSFEQLGDVQSPISCRSSPLSRNLNYEDRIDTVNDRPQHSPLSQDLNDSWETAEFRQVIASDKQNETSTPKVPQKKSIIPPFFPPSVDFQEKMKALKRNIDFNSSQSKVDIIPSAIHDKSVTTTNVRKQPPRNDINDVEAERLSKIFGIKKV